MHNLPKDCMRMDIHLQRVELTQEAKRIAEEEAKMEIARLQEALRVKMAEQLAAHAAEAKAAAEEGNADRQEEQDVGQDLDGEEEVVVIDSSSEHDNDDRRRIPVSCMLFSLLYILIYRIY
jgi:hypothetical protein